MVSPPAPVLRTARRHTLHVALQALRRGLLTALSAAPLALGAQSGYAVGDGFFFHRPILSITVRGGVDRPTASSDIWTFTTTNLTVNKGDFLAPNFQVDLGVRFSNRAELVFAAGASNASAPSEFRKFIDNNDQPIQQTTRLKRIPVTIGVRYALKAPEERLGHFAWIPSRFTPWIGGGAGFMNYSFSQIGDFVDFQTQNVFKQEYSATSWTPMGYANLGLDMKLTTRVWLTGDLRYSLARAPLDTPDSKFVGFGKIDLSGTAATIGLTFRM